MCCSVWAKQEKRDNLNKILDLLKKNELIFKDLNKVIRVSKPTLSGYIKTLELQSMIEHFDKPEDRRNQWYRIKLGNEKKVESELGKYEAINFIKEIHNPIYVDKKETGITGAVFLSEPSDPKDQKMYKDISKKALDPIPHVSLLKIIANVRRGLKPGTKMAIVLMIEKEPDKVVSA